MIVLFFVLSCLLIFLLTLPFFRWLPQSAGSHRTRELLCPARCSCGVGWGGQAAPRCSGRRSSQAGQKGKEPVGPRFAHLQSGEAIGTCCSPTLGPDPRRREWWRPGEGCVRRKSCCLSRGCGAQGEAVAFPSRNGRGGGGGGGESGEGGGGRAREASRGAPGGWPQAQRARGGEHGGGHPRGRRSPAARCLTRPGSPLCIGQATAPSFPSRPRRGTAR